jgi:hypothetical protein
MDMKNMPTKIIQISAGAGGLYALESDGSLWSYWWDALLGRFKWERIPLAPNLAVHQRERAK